MTKEQIITEVKAMELHESIEPYPPPVDQLLTLGPPSQVADRAELVLTSAPLTAEHIPELIRMVEDPALNRQDADEPEFYAPIHAWSALAHLKATEAIDALVRALDRRQQWDEPDEWSTESMPRVFAALGPGSMPPLLEKLSDPDTHPETAFVLPEFIRKIHKAHPQTRQSAIDGLISALQTFEQRTPESNSAIVAALLELEATEAVPLLRRVFHAGAVDRQSVGDWSDVRRDLNIERLPDDPPERKPGESLWKGSPMEKIAAALQKLPPSREGTPTENRSAKSYRKEAKKRKKQNRRC